MKIKMNLNMTFLVNLLVFIGILSWMSGCSHLDDSTASAVQSPPQKMRITRQHLLQAMASDQIVFSQHGQNMRLTVPTSKLFNLNATTLNERSLTSLVRMAHFIATYDIEQVRVTVAAPGNQDRAIALARSQRQAQIVQSELKSLLPSTPLMISRGRLLKAKEQTGGLGSSSYVDVGFRYIRKH